MIQICSYCKKYYGKKEPLEDHRITHGICPECYHCLMKEYKTVNQRPLESSSCPTWLRDYLV